MEFDLFTCLFIYVVVVIVVLLLISLFDYSDTILDLPQKCQGFATPGWSPVAEVFKKQVADGHCQGAGFAVYHKGQLVVEYVGGYADYTAEWPWDKTTLSCLFSATKGIGAIVIAILVDRGLLDYSSRVVNYWPEFAANGKESITVEQLISHQAGLIVLDEVYSLYDITKNPEKISHLLATARPHWDPGTKHGFHTLTMGLYMDQLVRRVDPKHRSIDKFFEDEVSKKFGIDCFIGLPKKENYRCSRFEDFSPCIVWDLAMTVKYWQCVSSCTTDSNLEKMLENCAEAEKDLYCPNIPAFREIPCASAHGYATAAGLAKLYGILANGGHHQNQTLLSPSAVKKLNEPLLSGIDAIYCLDSTVGRGTVIMRSKDGHNIFGYPGFCGQVGFADPKHKIGWAYVSNTPSIFINADDPRYRQLIESVYATVMELERR